MVSFSPIKNIINAALDLDLANPNLAISEKEKLLRDRAILLGTMDYYRTFPMKSFYVTTFQTTSDAQGTFSWAGTTPMHQDETGASYITFEELLTGSQPAAYNLEHAYFLGIGKLDRNYFANYSNPSIFSLQMFGFAQPGTSTYNKDLLALLTANTYDEISSGQPQFTISRERERVYVTNPFGIGMISFLTYWGYDTPEYCDMPKVDFMCKFISYRFIEAIIQARDGIKFDADFEISTTALQKRLDKLKDEIDSIRNHSILQQALWA